MRIVGKQAELHRAIYIMDTLEILELHHLFWVFGFFHVFSHLQLPKFGGSAARPERHVPCHVFLVWDPPSVYIYIYIYVCVYVFINAYTQKQDSFQALFFFVMFHPA